MDSSMDVTSVGGSENLPSEHSQIYQIFRQRMFRFVIRDIQQVLSRCKGAVGSRTNGGREPMRAFTVSVAVDSVVSST
jgi:hypothetical protein